VPASAAELALSARAGGCLAVVDEESGRTGRACPRHKGASIRADVLGSAEEWTLGGDGFPDRVELGAQGVRYLRDPAAEVPAAPPPLEVRVPGPPAGRTPRRFCGRAPDGPGPRVDLAALPRPVPDGSSCREQAEAYAALVRRTGLPARIALGVADDGAGFVWHAWVEARTRGGWVAVDPAFGELPARGPRFTVARHGGDVAGVAEAGREILRCWGRAAVE
jgi:transglutaminase-like putative cysteine protease